MTSPLAIVVHGGTGKWPAAEITIAREGCQQAASNGLQHLQSDNTALDAVIAAVVDLENHPLFNAGIGSVLNNDGYIEMDAAVMQGHTLAAGAVAGIRHFQNPILLAQLVMRDGRHILIAGSGAEQFAAEQGIKPCDPTILHVPKRDKQWNDKHGTVGAVAIDAHGHLAAATSTGGLFDKLPGRISDSALIGAGTYANAYGAVSCTGIGEAIIRVGLAKNIVTYIQNGLSAQAAADRGIQEFAAATQSEAGAIVIDHSGNIGVAHHAPEMAYAYLRS